MTPKLPVVRAREVIRVAEKLGFVLDRQKGSHAVYRRASDGARVVIPVHAGKDLKPKMLAGIIEDLGLTVERFREML
jgi:predicted RNA binding protein YcfA (HicA-like mRNA interferase family)